MNRFPLSGGMENREVTAGDRRWLQGGTKPWLSRRKKIERTGLITEQQGIPGHPVGGSRILLIGAGKLFFQVAGTPAVRGRVIAVDAKMGGDILPVDQELETDQVLIESLKHNAGQDTTIDGSFQDGLRLLKIRSIRPFCRFGFREIIDPGA